MDNTAIKIENLSKTFYPSGSKGKGIFGFIRKKNTTIKEIKALDSVSFEIRKGEVIGLLGRNGAGKSTLLKIIGEIFEPSGGSIQIDGNVASILEVGMGFHPDLTGRQNIYFSGELLGMTKKEIQSKFTEIIAFSEIGKFIDIPVKDYSSGMYLRLAFSIIAHLPADILLLDEVLSVGDVFFKIKCYNKIVELKNSGKTILMVSHNLSEIERFCDRAVLLFNGKIQSIGVVQEVLSVYAENSSETKSVKQQFANDANLKNENEYIKIESIVLNNNSQNITTKDPIKICIKYQNRIPETIIDFAIVLNDKSGNPVFSTSSLLNKEFKHIAKGNYQSILTIPGNLFNSTVFSLDISVLINRAKLLFYQPYLMFFKIDASEEEKQMEWRKHLPDLPFAIRPVLEWRFGEGLMGD